MNICKYEDVFMEIYLHNNLKPWFYTVKKSDEVYNLENGRFDLENFSRKFNFNIEEFENLNGKLKKVSYGDILLIPAFSKYFHIVQPAENLLKIAKLYNKSPEDISSLNNVKQIFVGQKLFL